MQSIQTDLLLQCHTMDEPFMCGNSTANFDNTKWLLENLCNEYKAGFESLKAMLPFCRSKLPTQQMDQFEYEIALVEANLAQTTEYYKSLEAIYYESFIPINNQPGLTANGCINIGPIDQLDQSYCHLESSINLNCELGRPDAFDMINGDKLTFSSMDYLLSVDETDDFFEFIKSDESDNLYQQTNSHTSTTSDQENQDQSCTLISVSGSDLPSESKPEKSNTKSQSRSHNKHSKSSSSSLKKARPNECRVWYKCGWEGCSFGSYYNGVVKRHSLKRHSGKIKIDKSSNSSMHRFKCDWPGCEVSLVAYHKLVEHKRKHTGEKPFRCKWKSCNYATARLYSMIIHERTHKLDPFAE